MQNRVLGMLLSSWFCLLCFRNAYGVAKKDQVVNTPTTAAPEEIEQKKLAKSSPAPESKLPPKTKNSGSPVQAPAPAVLVPKPASPLSAPSNFSNPESKPRSNWILGGEFSAGFAVSTFMNADQYQPLLLFQAHGAYDFTSNQCTAKERSKSIFCTEALVALHIGAGYLTYSDIPFFRVTLGFEFDFYFGLQRTVAFTLKWRMGYGRYALKSSMDQAGVIAENFQIPEAADQNRLEWGIGPGVLIQLGRLNPRASGVSIFADLNWVSPLNWGFVISVGSQYRF